MSFPEVMINRRQLSDICDQEFIAEFMKQAIKDAKSRISVIKQVIARPRIVDEDEFDAAMEIITSDSPTRYIDEDAELLDYMISILETAESENYNMENPKKCKLIYAIITNSIETVGVLYKNYMRAAQTSALIKIVNPILKIPADRKVFSDASKIIENNFQTQLNGIMYDLFQMYVYFDKIVDGTINIKETNQKYKQIIDKLTKLKESDDEQIQKVENIVKRLLENGKLPPNFKPPDLGPMEFDFYRHPKADYFQIRKDFLGAIDNMGEPTDADTAARNQYMGDTLPKMAIAEFLGGKSKTRKSRKTRKSKSRRSRK